jgi:K319-like protein
MRRNPLGLALAVLVALAACSEVQEGLVGPDVLDEESVAVDASLQLAEPLDNYEDYVATPLPTSESDGPMLTHSAAPVRIAGVGSSSGNRAANTVISSGDVSGTITRISHSTFNSMSPAALAAAYDVIIITWGTSGALNVDWASRLMPYMAAGGGVIFEDPNNTGDLAAILTTTYSGCDTGGTHNVVATIPGLTDGIGSNFVNSHICFTTWASWLTPYLQAAGLSNLMTGLAGTAPSGGRIVLHGPDHDYHALRANNQYNALVNDIRWLTSNEAPTADAGADQTIEWTTAGNGATTLDGSGSSDPNADALTYSWSDVSGVIATGVNPTVNLSLGSHTITLTVDDGNGHTATSTVTIDVVDTTAPTVTAALVPVAGKSLKSKKGQFTVEFTCADDCDPNAVATATLNGMTVENGQVVDLRLKSEKSDKSDKSEKSEKSKKSKKSEKPVKIEGTSFELIAMCVDASGNVGEATAMPTFAEKSEKSDKSDKSKKSKKG